MKDEKEKVCEYCEGTGIRTEYTNMDSDIKNCGYCKGTGKYVRKE